MTFEFQLSSYTTLTTLKAQLNSVFTRHPEIAQTYREPAILQMLIPPSLLKRLPLHNMAAPLRTLPITRSLHGMADTVEPLRVVRPDAGRGEEMHEEFLAF